jgi:predicted glycoside hydrolase/deacetylase ChbG (UPF0249 family)
VTDKFLIVNADDFGRSAGLNRGVIEAHEKGIVTSASLMVRWPAAEAAAAYASAHPRLGIGLHLDLCEWVVRDRQWALAYEVVPVSDGASVEREVERQVEAFERLLGRPPSHLDSHQHVHLEDTARPILERWGRRLGIPVRRIEPAIHHRGDFYGQTAEGEPLPDTVSAQHLVRIVGELAAGWTELACHPGYADDLETDYCEPRRLEIEALCDPSVRHALSVHGIELRSFADYRPATGTSSG